MLKVGDKVIDKSHPNAVMTVSRVLKYPTDCRKLAREFGSDWERDGMEAQFRAARTWYNTREDGNGVFYTEADLKPVKNNLGIGNPIVANAVAVASRNLRW